MKLKKENCLEVIREARDKLKQEPKNLIYPYVPVPKGIEKEYRKQVGDLFFDKYCFVTENI